MKLQTSLSQFESECSCVLIIALFSLLLSNAITSRRDKSILYSRVAILILLYSSLIALFSLLLSNAITSRRDKSILYSRVAILILLYSSLIATITIFSFAGVPPLMGFFAKQMVLGAALDGGYVFLVLIAILTSVIGGVYYLNIIKQVFFDKSEYIINPELKDKIIHGNILAGEAKKGSSDETISSTFTADNIVLSSYLTITTSVLTFTILFFIFTPQEWLNIANILALLLFNP